VLIFRAIDLIDELLEFFGGSPAADFALDNVALE